MPEAALESEIEGLTLTFENTEGREISAKILRLSRYELAFEVYGGTTVIFVSEALNTKLVRGTQTIYVGRAVVTAVVNVGTATVVEVKLGTPLLLEGFALSDQSPGSFQSSFGRFIKQWQKHYRIAPAFKAITSDMQVFLADMKGWLDQVELGIRSLPDGDRLKTEQEVAEEISKVSNPALTDLFEKFEHVAEKIEKEEPAQRVSYSAFAKRLLHPLLLSSPFLYRSYFKPLGYAGDYELVNMIRRNRFEGGSLFGKVVNAWFLTQAPAEAHRNRLSFLSESLIRAVSGAKSPDKPVRVLSLGCGPAYEVQDVIASGPFSDRLDFTLVDFDTQALEYARVTVQQLIRQHSRRTKVHFVKKSVNQILKDVTRTAVTTNGADQFDVVYCAGLFDYLSDAICVRLSQVLYQLVLPGGVYIFTNVDVYNPRRITMDYIMDWHLIYRTASQLRALGPRHTASEPEVISDSTGTNIYCTIRKPTSPHS